MLFHAMIENYDKKNTYVQVFWAHAAHLGEALEKMLKAAISIGIKNPIWRQADTTHLTSLPIELKKYEKLDVFWSDKKILL